MKRKIFVFAAAFLLSCFSFPAFAQNKPPPRVIEVNIAADQFYTRSNPRWREDIEKAIRKTNEVYGNLPKPITFKIKEIKIWNATTNLMDKLILEIEALSFSEKVPIVLGFTGQETECVDENNGRLSACVGLATFLGNSAVVSKNKGDNWPQSMRNSTPEEQASIVIHEVGHIFGAEHVDDIDSYMHESYPSSKERFDGKSIETIMKNRDREF